MVQHLRRFLIREPRVAAFSRQAVDPIWVEIHRLNREADQRRELADRRLEAQVNPLRRNPLRRSTDRA